MNLGNWLVIASTINQSIDGDCDLESVLYPLTIIVPENKIFITIFTAFIKSKVIMDELFFGYYRKEYTFTIHFLQLSIIISSMH